MIRAAADVLAACLNGKEFVSEVAFSTILREFNQLPKDDQWVKVAERIAAGYKSLPKTKDSEHKISSDLAILKIYAVLDSKNEIGALLAGNNEIRKAAPSVFALLVEHEKYWFADNLFKSFPTWDFAYFKPYHSVRYNADLARKIPLYIKRVKGDEKKFFAKLFLLGIDDPDEYYRPARGTFPTKPERLKPVVAQLATRKFSNPNLRNRAIFQVCRDWRLVRHAEKFFENEFKKRSKDIPKLVIFGNNWQKVDPRLQPMLAFSVHRISKGDATYYQKLMNLANGQIAKSHWRWGYCMERCVWKVNDMLEEDFGSFDQKQIEATYRAYSRFNSVLKHPANYREFYRGIVYQIALSSLLDNPKSLQNWRKQNQKNAATLQKILSETKDYDIPKEIGTALHLLKGETLPLTEAKQNALAETLLTDPWVKKLHKGESLVAGLIQHNILTPTYLEANCDQIAATANHPNDSLAIGRYFARKDNWERARQFGELALKQATEQKMNANQIAGIRVGVSGLRKDF